MLKRLALTLLLIAPSWATANERSFICTAEVAIGWKKKSPFDSVGRVQAENQWLLSPINKIDVPFYEKEKEALPANYTLKLLGKDDVKGYCGYFINEEKTFETASCFFLSPGEERKGSLLDSHWFYLRRFEKEDITYQTLNNSAFFGGSYLYKKNVGYEQGSCKGF